MQGWDVTPSEFAFAWTVKDGVITGTGPKKRCYLEYSNKNIANLELKLQYRFPGKGNSGINIRAIPDPTGKRDWQAYHADLGHVGIGKHILGAWDFHTPGRKEHGCPRGSRLTIDYKDQAKYEPIKDSVRLTDIREHDWNSVRIIARDNHFQLYLNGKLASEFTENLPLQQRLRRGRIQLQLHDPKMVVQFRKIYLKILD